MDEYTTVEPIERGTVETLVLPDGREIRRVVYHPPGFDAQGRWPEPLLQDTPAWARELLARDAPVNELVRAVGIAARAARTSEEVQVVRGFVRKLPLLPGAREAIVHVLGPSFLPWLFTTFRPDEIFALFPRSLTVYDNPNVSGPGASMSISEWEDEAQCIEAALQAADVNQSISAVQFEHLSSFGELFLFDGPDLQGNFVRIAQERTTTPPAPVVLGEYRLDNQARSLLASIRHVPGRRFSARDQLLQKVSALFPPITRPFGTAALAKPPEFSWDGYALWRTATWPVPKLGALRLTLDFNVNDSDFGATAAQFVFDKILSTRENGGLDIYGAPLRMSLPQPWAGGFQPPESRRWLHALEGRYRHYDSLLFDFMAQIRTTLLSSFRVLPGRSLEPGYSVDVPPTGPRQPRIEAGHTVGDATIVVTP